jgi:hypothetical protein
MNTIKEKIAYLDAERYTLLNKEELGTATVEEVKKIDTNAVEIRYLILKHFDLLEFDYILIQLTRIGDAPNLLYDDNGHFAVECEGVQTVPDLDDVIDIETSFFVEKHKWKSTPREALLDYLQRD